MSRLQAIEQALASINPASFQELCDSFLALRNPNYTAFTRTGSQSGKQKTVKGTPDTFLLLPNGKYIFVEYSTNVSAGITKLEEDIAKCIDKAKTGIPTEQIAEIIICVNFNLKADEIQTLNSLLSATRIILTVYTLDALALELHLHHRDLAHQYLGLPLDTGQVVSMEQFVKEYNRASKGISTQLDNEFLHREKELKHFNKAICENDFVILTGPPGVGKTKLALEGIKNFLIEHLSYNAYCISFKSHTLLDDLYQYLDLDKDYILFVDDANRIDAFNQIIGFYKTTRSGKLKIIITVRDYAYREIGVLCSTFLPKLISLNKLEDAHIIDIIKAQPFEILNPRYHTEIVRIADGNPRIAIMTALLSKAKQDIHALADVSELFNNYFSTFVKDDGEFANNFNIKCLGIIAFFYTIPYKNKGITTAILNNFGIEYPLFIEAIDKLDKLELVEVQFEHVKIPEQNLATFFFYKAFIKDNLLPFNVLLDKYFESNSNQFKDSVIPANNMFNPDNVVRIKPYLQSHYKAITHEQSRAFHFLSTFWFYLEKETFEFFWNLINSLPINDVKEYSVTYETNTFAFDKDQNLRLLGNFFSFPTQYLNDALSLSFEYVRKLPQHLPELIHKIRETLLFDRDDRDNRFFRQTTLYELLLKGLTDNDPLYTIAFYELSKTFLDFKFRITKSGRHRSIVFYEFPIPNTPDIREFRKNIWNALNDKFEEFPKESLDLLNHYARVQPDVEKEIMEYDVPFVMEIIEKHLSPQHFEHCDYVHDQIRWYKRNSVTHVSFEDLADKFTNPTYETFLKIDWDRFRDKEIFDFDDYKEYEELKEKEIRKFFIFHNLTEIKAFYTTFVYLKGYAKKDWNYTKTLDIIVDETCAQNFALGCEILTEIILHNNEVNYIPRMVFYNHLNTPIKADLIWKIIQQGTFNEKGNWELSFYDYIDESLLKDYVIAVIDTIKSLEQGNQVFFGRLQRFLKVDPTLFQKILKIVVEKNEVEQARLMVWSDFFEEHFDKLGKDMKMIERAYLQQDRLQDHFDYDGEGLLNILKRDKQFLVQYVEDVYSRIKTEPSGDHLELRIIWQVDEIEPILKQVFDFAAKEPFLGILDHFCNAFFNNVKPEHKEKAKAFLLDYCKEHHADIEKMNMLLDIVLKSMKEIYEEVVLLFLSLCQDKDTFSEVRWHKSGAVFSGDTIIGDLRAAEWRELLSIVEKSQIGIKLLPIKIYINEQIESQLRYGDLERQRRFLERY